jgi:hypothetical protein
MVPRLTPVRVFSLAPSCPERGVRPPLFEAIVVGSGGAIGGIFTLELRVAPNGRCSEPSPSLSCRAGHEPQGRMALDARPSGQINPKRVAQQVASHRPSGSDRQRTRAQQTGKNARFTAAPRDGYDGPSQKARDDVHSEHFCVVTPRGTRWE